MTAVSTSETIIETRGLSLWYGAVQALRGISMSIYANRVTALIGPSGCGKSSLIRCFNRINDLVPESRVEGAVLYRGRDVYDPGYDVVELRKRIGMVFQKPNPFPMSIYENVVYGPRVHGERDGTALDAIAERSLRRAALWDEVRDRLGDSALSLSGGQQQRLCIARTLAIEPDVVLMDEPASALDPIATAKIENLIDDLKQHYTVILVTHHMQQAARVSEYTGFMHLGELIEYGETLQVFERPREHLTENYITGRFG